jgi:hypothetical protein
MGVWLARTPMGARWGRKSLIPRQNRDARDVATRRERAFWLSYLERSPKPKLAWASRRRTRSCSSLGSGDHMLPVVMRMGRDDEAVTVQILRRKFRRLYGEYAERVLVFCLRTWAP